MSQHSSTREEDETGGNEGDGADSEVVDLNSRVISQNIFNILQNPTAAEWDLGTVNQPDGNPFDMWSNHSPAPTQGREEMQAAFTLWLHAARLERSQVLANRAERQEAALKTHCESFQQPPPLPTPSEADRLEKQSLLQRLASQAVENTIDPRDQLIFAFIDNAGGDAARAAFQKVLAPENTLGLDAMTAAEKELVFRW